MKFQCISNTPTNHQNGLPKPPKVSKMRSQEVPEVIKIMKMLKKWNLKKTTLFTILLIGWDIINQQNFHSKILKIHVCTPNMFFDASNHRKYQKVIQTGVQRGTQNPSKIIKNPPWDLPGSLSVHLWPNWLQNDPKMVSKDLQMEANLSPGDPKMS